jgi:hypothetical protein
VTVAAHLNRLIGRMLSKKAIEGLREVAESSARAQSDEDLVADAETVERVSQLVHSDVARAAFVVLAEVYRAELARRTATPPRKRKASGRPPRR